MPHRRARSNTATANLANVLVLAAAIVGAAGAHAGTPPPPPEVTIGDVSLVEGNAGTKTFGFTVTLSAADAVTDTVVDFDVSDVEAKAPGDYTNPGAGTITIDHGTTTGTINITVKGDNTDEIDETFLVTLTGVSANAVLGADVIGTGTIQNDDAANAPTISIDDVSIAEAAANLTFTLSLNKTAGRTITVDFATADVTAAAGADYSNTRGTATFNEGDSSVTIDVPILEDALDEVTETFNVNLANAQHASISGGDNGVGTGTITDDGDTPPKISVLDQSTTEGAGTFNVVVTLDRPSGRSVTVDFDTSSGTASTTTDITDTSGTLTFAPGVTSQTAPVSITQDTIDEPDEAFHFNLSGATGGASIDTTHDTADVTIADDDATPIVSVTGGSTTESSAGGNGDDVVFTLTLDHASSTAQTVHVLTRDGTAVGSSTTANTNDYDIIDSGSALFVVTFAAGDTSATVRVDTNDDTTPEDDEDFFLDVSSPSAGLVISSTANSAEGIIHDDDTDPTVQITSPAAIVEGNGGGAGGATLVFDVTLSKGSERDVKIDFATAGATATSGSDFTAASGTLDFGGDPTSTVLHVNVPITGDLLDEDNETFTVTLSNPVHTSIPSGKNVAVGTITDDDTAPTASITDVTVSEGDSGTTTMTFVVSLSAPSGKNITVNASTSDGTARQPGDYTQRLAVPLAFAAGTTTQNFDVTVKGDPQFENTETVNAAISSPTNATLADNLAVGTILNDDPVPTLSVSDATLDPEGNAGARNLGFTVSLTNPSDQIISFDFESRDETALAGSDYVAQSGSGVINAGATSTTVNIVVGGDTLDEPNETFHLHINSVTNATLGDDDAIGTIVDDDNPPTISIVQPIAPATEGNNTTRTLTFDVVLSAPTGNLVTVHATSVDDTAVANPGGAVGDDDYVALPDTVLTFTPGETVKHIDMTVKPDQLDEADTEQFKVVLTQPQNAAILVATGIGKINDDDATPTLDIDNVTLNPEGNTGTEPATFTVTLSAASGRDVQVAFATQDGGLPGEAAATAGVDYVAASGLLLFPRGTLTQTVVVQVFEDTSEEPDEHFSVVLSAAENATIQAPGFGEGTVLNDDAGPTTNSLDGLPDGFADGSPYETNEEVPLVVSVNDGLLKNDQDNNGDPLFAFVFDDVDPAEGALELFPTGAFTFTPADDFAGEVHFTYFASDGTNDSAPQDVKIIVLNLNDAPVMDAAAFDVHQTEDDADPDGMRVADYADARITDVDVAVAGGGDQLGVAVVGLPDPAGAGGPPGAVEFSLDSGATWTAITTASETAATLVPHGARLRLVPPQDGDPIADVVVRAWDGHGGAPGSRVDLTAAPLGPLGAASFFSSATGIVRITVDAVNDAPVFVSPTPDGAAPLVALEGVAFAIDLAATDVDDDATDLVFTLDEANSALPTAANPLFTATAGTGTASLTFTSAFTDAGAYHARFVVTDTAGDTDVRNIDINAVFIDVDGDTLPDTWEARDDVGLSSDPETGADSDGDGIGDVDEVEPLPLPLAEGLGVPPDTDNDGTIDALDDDSDDDGVTDSVEAGDDDITTPPPDSDGDGVADFRDTNSDDDAVEDGVDNCRTVKNDDQADLDRDNVGDVCDNDQDGDRLLDEFEPGLGLDPRNPDCDGDGILDGDEVGDPQNPFSTDDDGVIDALDTDSDGDGVPDEVEAGDAVLVSPPVDTDGDGTPDFQDLDSDDDNVDDETDNCRVTKNTAQTDLDDDGVGDACLEVCGDGKIQEPEECDDGDDDDNLDDANPVIRCDATCHKICGAETCNGLDDDCDGVVDIVATSAKGGTHSVCAERDIKITGGGVGASCGCSSGTDGAPFAFALVLLALMGLRRRRTTAGRDVAARHGEGSSSVAACVLGVVVLAVAAVSPAKAADDGLNVQQLWPATGSADDIVSVEGTAVNGHLRPSAGLVLDYGYRALNVSDAATNANVSLLEHRLDADVLASISLFERGTVGVAIPVTVFQATGSDDVFQPAPLDVVALGDVRLDGRFTIFGENSDGGPALAVAAAVTAPTGSPKQLEGYGFLTVEPRVIGGWRFGSRARAFGNLGYLVRPRQELLGFAVGNEVTYAAGGAYSVLPMLDVLGELDGRLAADPSVAITGAGVPLEARLGARWHLLPGHDITAAGGLGVTGGYGTPLFRVVVGYMFTLPGDESSTAKQAAPDSDRDHDGVYDVADKCPDIAEDKDGIQDEDGCPEVDADEDGVPDNVDQCPEVAEDKDGFEDGDGCPDLDKDGDGINDDKDDCVDQPEDRDGFEDADGCPDPDNDGDGVKDVDDKCKNEPAQTPDGCPPHAGGGEPARANGGGENASAAPLIELPQRIYFKTNGTEVTTEGKRLLEQIAETLKTNTDVRVEVQGHADTQGGGKVNDQLSLRRSQAVIDILVGLGVPRQRFLIAVIGDNEPLAPNDTPQGRALNRRVQFRVLPP